MTLESLITDEQKVTFDCCKATITKGKFIEVPDVFYDAGEIQGAIKLGLVRLVGPAPVTVAAALGPVVRKIKLRNRLGSPIALDCVKGHVPAGGTIEIPENLMHEREIQNAISWNMLEDVDNPKPTAEAGLPAVVEEISVGDVDLNVSTQIIETRPRQAEKPEPKRAVRQAARKPAVRPIQRSADREGDDLYVETQVMERPAARRGSPPISIDVESGPESVPEVSFDDIFEGQ